MLPTATTAVCGRPTVLVAAATANQMLSLPLDCHAAGAEPAAALNCQLPAIIVIHSAQVYQHQASDMDNAWRPHLVMVGPPTAC